MFDVQYFIDEEKKVVVAKIIGTALDVSCDLCKLGYHEVPTVIEDSYVGKAKCCPEDTFDVEVGKKIAFKRAFAKYTKAKHRELSKFRNWLVKNNDAFINTIDKLLMKYDATEKRRYTEVEYLINNNK
jgi:hypothetical protein